MSDAVTTHDPSLPWLRVPRRAPLRGMAFMLVASLAFAAMNALAHVLGAHGVPWQMSGFARAFVGLLVAWGIAAGRGRSLRVVDRRTMWIRSLAGSTSMLCTFYALTHLPLADATSLLNTTPLWIAGLAFWTIGERPGRWVVVALVLAFAGVVLIEQPSLAGGSFAGLVALCAGMFSALAMVSLRRLRGETPEAVVVHFTAIATAIQAAVLAAQIHRHGWPHAWSGSIALELVFVGVTATLGQLAMTRAYAADRAARVGAAGWVQILFALALDVLLTHRSVPLATLGGIGLMLLAGVVLVQDARRAAG